MNNNANNQTGTVDIIDTPDAALTANDAKKISASRLMAMGIIGLACLAGAGYLLYKYFGNAWNFAGNKQPPAKTERLWSAAPDNIGRNLPSFDPAPQTPPTTQSAAPPESAPANEAESGVFSPPPPPQTVPQQATAEQTEQPPSLSERRRASSLAAYNPVEKPQVEARVPSRQVKRMENPDYTLVKGTKLPCTLETTIISEQQGFASCIISQDVYSGNARILLLEKGTKVTGEYRGEVRNGDRRLQIIWDRLITPYDVVVQLDSPVTDRLGASGITGKVDNRWGARIGSALLISMLSDALQIIGDNSERADVIVNSETADTSQTLAEQILDKNINLAPIIYISEGQMLNIYVADDIDLSAVYRVEHYGY